MEAEGALHRRGLVRVLLRDGDHGFHTLRRHQHAVQTQEGVLERLTNILARLELGLLAEPIREVALAEFGALETTMTIEDSENADALVKIGIRDMCILL